MLRFEKVEFTRLFQEFVNSYPSTLEGEQHIRAYEENRRQGRQNFQTVVQVADRGEDATDLVLLKLLPHADTSGNRDRGAWVHIAPAIQGNLKGWFERRGWANPEDWPRVAEAILDFVRRCNEDPNQLSTACRAFSELPYSKGFQTGMLTPILNALRPDDFLIINYKSRQTINYFTDESYSSSLTNYPDLNAIGHELVEEVAEEMHRADSPEMRDDDLFDTFSHWLVAIKKYEFRHTRYWKIAPGKGAWQWDEWRREGFAAIGWNEVGDASALSRAEFDARRDELVTEHEDWSKAGVNQVWTFAHHIKEGDRIVANRGTSEVLGIGTVVGSYEFVPGAPHSHQLPVEWDDYTPRRVHEGGWRKTLIELDREKFESIRDDSLVDEPLPRDESPFSSRTFELLAELHENPIADFYRAHREEFREYVEEPFQQLFSQVAEQLPAAITESMETKSRVFAKITKNDWGRGGAWDYYWGAFYPKGGKRIEAAQLFLWINRERLDFGFFIAEYGGDQRERFIRNCKENREVLPSVLQDSLADNEMVFGRRKELLREVEGPQGGEQSLTWENWLKEPKEEDLRASVVLSKHEVLGDSEEQLIRQITQTYERLYPLVLLATTDDPMSAIGEYLEATDGQTENPAYSLAQCAEDTGFDEERLQQWVRAIERKRQAIIYGPPGTGKTFVAERLARHLIGGTDGYWEIIQFHPEYAYEDFIQGIRPQTRSEGGLEYPLVPGRFLKFCREARYRDGCCVMIVDEINRANLSRVFGELMYLLEYRGREVPLAGGEALSIPGNVRMIGTMNTADRSIILADHALRRRFAFLKLYPDYKVLRRYHEQTDFPVDSLVEVLTRLNQEIGDPHHEVGITFFLHKDLREQIEDVWQMEIEPYLEEYFFDQPDKVDRFRWERVRENINP